MTISVVYGAIPIPYTAFAPGEWDRGLARDYQAREEARASLRSLAPAVGAEQVELAEIWAAIHQVALFQRACRSTLPNHVIAPAGEGLREARRRLLAGRRVAADGTWSAPPARR